MLKKSQHKQRRVLKKSQRQAEESTKEITAQAEESAKEITAQAEEGAKEITENPAVSLADDKTEKSAEITAKEPEKTVEAPKISEKKENKLAKAKITFKVQILASSKEIPLKSENFRGLSALSKEPYKNLHRYMYGSTNSYKQAQMLKSNADLKGYSTSFIVAYKEGIRIPLKEAMKYVSE